MTTTEPTFEELAKRVDDAVAALDDLDPAAREKAERLGAQRLGSCRHAAVQS